MLGRWRMETFEFVILRVQSVSMKQSTYSNLTSNKEANRDYYTYYYVVRYHVTQ